MLGVGVVLLVIVRLTDGDLVTDLLLLGVGVVLRVIVRLTEGDLVTDLLLLGEGVSERVFVGVTDGLATIVRVPEGVRVSLRVTEGDRVILRVTEGERLTDLLLVGVREFEKKDGSLIGILGIAVGRTGIVGNSVTGITVGRDGSSV